MPFLDMYTGTQNALEAELERVEEEDRLYQERLQRIEAAGARGVWARCKLRCAHVLTVFADSPKSFFFLILVGVVTALMGYTIDVTVKKMLEGRLSIARTYSFGSALAWSFWCVGFATLATTVGPWISLRAEGSGIPQMKSLLAGTPLYSYLTPSVLVAKVIGIVFALGSGLIVGKEGPFVHIASIVARNMGRIPYFRDLLHNETMRRHLLAAAVSAGVTAVLGAPVGGVLFSIEVTTTYYLVGNLWRGFLCSLACVFTYEVINVLQDDELFRPTEFVASDVSWQIVAFAILAVLCGLLAAAFVQLTARAQLIRRALLRRGGSARRYILSACVALVVGFLTFPAPFLRKSDKDILDDLFHEPGRGWEDWTRTMPAWLALVLFIGLRSLLTPVCISLPIPCGLFTPLFALGAALGRLFGEIMAVFAPHSAVPAAYAVVGAAALSAGATQSLSTAVIVFELTRQLHHMLPVLLAAVIAYTVAGMFGPSIYDVLLSLQRLPHLGRAHGSQYYSLRARDVMHRTIRCLALDSTFVDAYALLRAQPLNGKDGQPLFALPVVDSFSSMHLVGAVPRESLLRIFAKRGLGELDSKPVSLPFALRPTPPPSHPPSPEFAPRDDSTDKQASGGGGGGGGGGEGGGGVGEPRNPVPVEAAEAPPAPQGGWEPLESPRGAALHQDGRGHAPRGPPGSQAAAAAATPVMSRRRSSKGVDVEVENPSMLLASEAAAEGGYSWDALPSIVDRFPVWMRQTIRFTGLVDPDFAVSREGRGHPEARAGAGDVGDESLLRTGSGELELAEVGSSGSRLEDPLTAEGTVPPGEPSPVPSTPPSRVAGVDSEGLPLSLVDMESPILVDPAPISVSEWTPLTKIHYLFAVCLFTELFVTKRGRLIGIILKEDLSNPRRLTRNRLV